jgi:hypothetical protein
MGSIRVTPGRWTLLLSLGLVVVGSAGYFGLQRGTWAFYAFAHAGALGVIGLLATAAAALARVKGRGYWKGFSVTGALSIIAGIVAVLIYLWGVDGNLYCGGSVCLGVAIVMIAFYALVRCRNQTSPTAVIAPVSHSL